MSNIVKLKYNFFDKLDMLNKELTPYYDLVNDYEKYADKDLPRRTMIIYPGGTTQKSWYANRKQELKQQRIDNFELYDAMSLRLFNHQTHTTTLSAKYLKDTSTVVDYIKKSIENEVGCDLSKSEAIVGQRYKNFVLKPHIDGDNETNRYHLIISTNEGNCFKDCKGITHNLEPGEIWQLDVTKSHEVKNLGDNPVRYMIIDEK